MIWIPVSLSVLAVVYWRRTNFQFRNLDEFAVGMGVLIVCLLVVWGGAGLWWWTDRAAPASAISPPRALYYNFRVIDSYDDADLKPHGRVMLTPAGGPDDGADELPKRKASR